jgi:hypothetical protein
MDGVKGLAADAGGVGSLLFCGGLVAGSGKADEDATALVKFLILFIAAGFMVGVAVCIDSVTVAPAFSFVFALDAAVVLDFALAEARRFTVVAALLDNVVALLAATLVTDAWNAGIFVLGGGAGLTTPSSSSSDSTNLRLRLGAPLRLASRGRSSSESASPSSSHSVRLRLGDGVVGSPPNPAAAPASSAAVTSKIPAGTSLYPPLFKVNLRTVFVTKINIGLKTAPKRVSL